MLVERDPVVKAARGVCENLLRLFPRCTECKPPLRLPSPVRFQEGKYFRLDVDDALTGFRFWLRKPVFPDKA